MSHSSRAHGGSVSSTGSLTFSDYSNFSEDCKTPPPCSPRAQSPAAFSWDHSPDSVSSQSSIEEDERDASGLSEEAALALKRLDLHVPWSTPLSSSEECGIAIFAASPSPKGKMRKRPSHLKMDFSNVRRFEAPGQAQATTPNTAMMLHAPLIGCIDTPSPTSLHFNVTPRPGLVSRFSDDSPSILNDNKPPFSSPNPSSARAALPALQTSGNTSPWSSATPITPRTVDALDVFGITSNVSSCLMRRGGSRDSKGSSPLSRSPEHSRSTLMAKSPLGLPLISSRPKMTRGQSSPLVAMDARSAQTLYHSLLPGAISTTMIPTTPEEWKNEVALTPEALNTPFEWVHEPDTIHLSPHLSALSQPRRDSNPYFMSAFTTA